VTITALDDGRPLPNGGGPPVVTRDARGGYVVTWPHGKAATVELTAELFESMVSDLNNGRIAVEALQAISSALSVVVPSA
jgi:hypothetical protein